MTRGRGDGSRIDPIGTHAAPRRRARDPVHERARAVRSLGITLAAGLLAAGIAVASRREAREPAAAGAPDRRGALDAGWPAIFASSGVPQNVRGELGPGDYTFLPVRHAVWAVNRTDGRFARFEFREDSQGLVRRSRVVTLDKETFDPSATVFLVSDRYLTEDLWIANRRTGLVELWEARLDGSLASRRSTHDLGPGSYSFLPSRYTIWVVDKTRGSIEYMHFRRDQDQRVIRSNRAQYPVVDFPARDTALLLSERNYSEVLWLANRRTADVQIWQPSATGEEVRLTGTFASSL
jgi:hypothetical protein